MRKWILAAMLVAALAGALALAILDAPRRAEARLMADLNTVRMGLEQYATDHGGRYPADAEVAKALGMNHYLPGPLRVVGDRAALGRTGDPSAHAPGTLLYHMAPGRPAYAIAAVTERGGRAVLLVP